MPTYESTIEIDGQEVEVVVEYTAVEASGDGWDEPHVPAHIEIEKVTIEDDGREIVLSGKEEAWMEKRIAEALKAFED